MVPCLGKLDVDPGGCAPGILPQFDWQRFEQGIAVVNFDPGARRIVVTNRHPRRDGAAWQDLVRQQHVRELDSFRSGLTPDRNRVNRHTETCDVRQFRRRQSSAGVGPVGTQHDCGKRVEACFAQYVGQGGGNRGLGTRRFCIEKRIDCPGSVRKLVVMH